MANKSTNITLGVAINALRFVLALVFVFSGFVKAVDPMGTIYKMVDYCEAFGIAIQPRIVWTGVWTLIIVEYVMGVALLCGLYRRFYLWMITAFLMVMTPLTLLFALTNPVSDCGCFGDAVVLTNWQTFGKNVVLLVMAILVLVYHRRVWRVVSERKQWLVFVYALVSIALFMQYNLRHLPVLDFRPYAIGTNIIEDMSVPEEASLDEFETLFVLEKEGERRTFTFDDYPDSTWTFVKRENRLVRKGYVPRITDFHLITLENEEVTWEVLEHPGYTFLMIASDLSRTNEGMLDVINDLYDYARVNKHAFYMLTSSGEETINSWIEHTGAAYPYLNADEILLNTIIRANPGLVILKDATVVGKWSAVDMPRDEQLDNSIEHNAALVITPREILMRRIIMVLCMFFPLLYLVMPDRERGKTKGTKV